jgi:hypothetical protein
VVHGGLSTAGPGGWPHSVVERSELIHSDYDLALDSTRGAESVYTAVAGVDTSISVRSVGVGGDATAGYIYYY